MADRERMSDAELVNLIQSYITDSTLYDRSDITNQREWAIKFYDGHVDIQAREGRSQVVSHDVADVHEWVLSGLLRVFTGSDKLVIYEPEKPEDEPLARAATAAINYIFRKECQGYRVLKDAMHDGLLHGNGIIKCWWEGSPKYEVEDLNGLDEQEFRALISQSDIDDVLSLESYLVGPDGQPLPGQDAGGYGGGDEGEETAEPVDNPVEDAAEQSTGQRPELSPIPGVPPAPPPPPTPPMPLPGMPSPTMGLPALPGMPPPPEKRFNIKIKRCIKSGEFKIAILPNEDFMIDMSAMTLDNETRFVGDVTRMTRSAAKLKWPKKADAIDTAPMYTLATDRGGTEKQARENRLWSLRETPTDPATEEIEIFETFPVVDYNGDGVAERRRVCLCGLGGEYDILSNDEWTNDHPYVSVTPNPMPHRWRGRSLFDDVGDVQRVKTALLRGFMDNLYVVNAPQKVAMLSAIINPDSLTNPIPNGVIWTNSDPQTAVVPEQPNFVGDKVLMALEYWDMTMEKRTGVSRSSMGLDTDTLQYQTAEAVKTTRSVAFTKVETYARNIAEDSGFHELFAKMLRLLVQNQKSTKYVQIGGKPVQVDPRGWNVDMKISINIGLGSGSREQDLNTLGGISQKQEQAIMALQSPFNPVLNVGHVFATYRKMVEAAGLRNPEQFFPEVDQQQIAGIFQQMQQNQPPPPEVLKMQGEQQIEQAKIAAKDKQDQARFMLDQQQANIRNENERVQAANEAAVKDRMIQAANDR